MPRQILMPGEKTNIDLQVSNASISEISTGLSKGEINRILRKTRSKEYIEVMTRLDTGGHVCSRAALDVIIDAIRKELPELSYEHFPVGIVAKCFLEPPHEVHTLDCQGQIIQHYKTYEQLPALLERARSLALHPDYAFVEVYTDCLRPVRYSGEVSVSGGDGGEGWI